KQARQTPAQRRSPRVGQEGPGPVQVRRPGPAAQREAGPREDQRQQARQEVGHEGPDAGQGQRPVPAAQREAGPPLIGAGGHGPMARKSAVASCHPLDRACACFDAAWAAEQRGELRDARAQIDAAIALFRRHAGREHPDLAHALIVRARVAGDRQDHLAAIRDGRRALAMLAGPRRELEVVRLRAFAASTLGAALLARGRYAEAEAVYRPVLSDCRRRLGARAPEVATLANNLAVIYKYTGRFGRAAQLYRHALALIREHAGPDHVEVATVLHNLGGLMHAAGRYREAEPYAREAAELRARALGEDHLDVAADRAALAAILEELGRLDEAEQIYRDVLARFERAYGPEHYELCIN